MSSFSLKRFQRRCIHPERPGPCQSRTFRGVSNDGRHLSCLATRRQGAVLPQSAGAMMAAPIATRGGSLAPGAPVCFPTRIVGGGVDAQQGRQYESPPTGAS